MSHVPLGWSQVSGPRAHAHFASGGRVRGTANCAPFSSGARGKRVTIGRSKLRPSRRAVQAMIAVMRRQDGGSPCGGRGTSALPSVAASCDPPAGRDKRSLCGFPQSTPKRLVDESYAREYQLG